MKNRLLWRKTGVIITHRGKIITCNSCPCTRRFITISGCIDHLEWFFFDATSIHWEHNPEWDDGYRQGVSEPGMHGACNSTMCHGMGNLGYPWVLVDGKMWNLNTGDFRLPFVIKGFIDNINYLRFYDPASGPHCLSQSLEVIAAKYDDEEFE